jgi:phosphatidylinositol alpha-1,6-mannosyltransferase
LRILALLTDGLGASGGIARYNSDLLAALSRSGAVSDVVALPRFGSGATEKLARTVQLEASPGRLGWALSAAALALRGKFDVIFCGHLNAAPFASRLARLTSRRLWIQVHGIEAWAPRSDAYRRALASARLVTSVSRFTRARLLAWSDIDPARVRVLPNTISAVAGRRTRPAHLLARHGLKGTCVILTVGRLAPTERYKGHDRIIEALPEVASRVPAARYLIVGSGDDIARLEELTRRTGMRERVVFAGAVSPAELADYFQIADVFAMPSTGEGFGIVFLEAAAADLPVIAGNRDGSVDALADGAIGALLDPESTSALARALVAALEGRLPSGLEAVRRFDFANFAEHVDGLVRHHL